MGSLVFYALPYHGGIVQFAVTSTFIVYAKGKRAFLVFHTMYIHDREEASRFASVNFRLSQFILWKIDIRVFLEINKLFSEERSC